MRGHQHTNLIDPILDIESNPNGAAIGAEGIAFRDSVS